MTLHFNHTVCHSRPSDDSFRSAVIIEQTFNGAMGQHCDEFCLKGSFQWLYTYRVCRTSRNKTIGAGAIFGSIGGGSGSDMARPLFGAPAAPPVEEEQPEAVDEDEKMEDGEGEMEEDQEV
jgi:hypothetical protein